MIIAFVLLGLINLLGVVVCRSVAKSRGSQHIVFWTGMGLLFGPLAIPFLLIFTRAAT